MNTDILDDSIIDAAEPITPNELIAHLLQDIVDGNPPSDVADEFVEEFLIAERPETGQILSLLERPTDGLVELLKAFVGQGYQASITALDERGAPFLERLKAEVRERMTEMASSTD